MAFRRAHYRAMFDGGLDTSEIDGFIDAFYEECAKPGIDGLIVEHGGTGTFIIEGDDAKVGELVNFLSQANELVNGVNYFNETSGGFYTCLASHVSADNRDTTC